MPLVVVPEWNTEAFIRSDLAHSTAAEVAVVVDNALVLGERTGQTRRQRSTYPPFAPTVIPSPPLSSTFR